MKSNTILFNSFIRILVLNVLHEFMLTIPLVKIFGYGPGPSCITDFGARKKKILTIISVATIL